MNTQDRIEQFKRKLYKRASAMTTAEAAVKSITEAPIQVTVGDRNYTVKPPTMSVYLRISSIVSKYPMHKEKTQRSADAIIKAVLLDAAKYEDTGEIMAALILGWQKYPTDEFLAEYTELSGYIEDTLTPTQMDELMYELLDNKETARFFELTASLSELNLLEEKRKEDQSGDSSSHSLGETPPRQTT